MGDLGAASYSVWFVASSVEKRIYRVEPWAPGIWPGDYRIRIIAGDGSRGLQDGLRTDARFDDPRGIDILHDSTTTTSLSVFIAEYSAHVIRKITYPYGLVSTIGEGVAGDTDGPLSVCRFYHPHAIAAYQSSQIMVGGDRHIKRVDINNDNVTTLIGGPVAGTNDGIGTNAKVYLIRDLEAGPDNDYLFWTGLAQTVRQVDMNTLAVTTLTGTPMTAGLMDGPLAFALFSDPMGLAVDFTRSPVMYISENGNKRIRSIDMHNMMVSNTSGVAGTTAQDGKGTSVVFASPMDIDNDPWSKGGLVIMDEAFRTIKAKNLIEKRKFTVARSPTSASPRPFPPDCISYPMRGGELCL